MAEPFDNKVYQNEYHKAMKHKLVSFNPNDPEDMKIYQFLMSKGKGKVTAYIKSLIRMDMGHKTINTDTDPELDYLR